MPKAELEYAVVGRSLGSQSYIKAEADVLKVFVTFRNVGKLSVEVCKCVTKIL